MTANKRVVVIGGGVVGVSILYHLAKLGWKDCALLERTELTAGSTWHAAGLLPLYHPGYSISRINQYSVDLYQQLEKETGQPVSFHKTGNLRLATSQDRMDEYKAYCDTANTSAVNFELISPSEVQQLWPLMDIQGVIGALYHPDDGHIAPADLTQALAKGARCNGAKIHRNTEVTGMQQTPSGEWHIRTTQGEFIAEHIVCATGFYARQTAQMVGLELPCVSVLHQFLVTDVIAELQQRNQQGLAELPVLREDRVKFYLREERQGLIFGPYDPDPPVWAVDGVPPGFGQELLAGDLDRMIDQFEGAAKIIPLLNQAGVKEIINGPIAHTPDGSPLVGPAWGLKNFWLAEGNTFGILLAGGVGRYLAEWIIAGEPSIDMFAVDPRRYGGYADKNYTVEKSIETYGHVFDIHYPNLEMPATRPLKTSPCYSKMSDMGAVWGEKYGWERANWFAADASTAFDEHSFHRSNDFASISNECHTARNNVALIDFTPFSKFEITGTGSSQFIDRLIANRLPEKGRTKLAHVLTNAGGIRSEFTVSCLDDNHYYIVTPAWAERFDDDLLTKTSTNYAQLNVKNITEEKGVFVITGPKSRTLLQRLSDDDLSSDNFPWYKARYINIHNLGQVLAIRLSYIGELGFELHHDLSQQLKLFDLLFANGKDLGLLPIGMRAIDSLRLEKSYRGWDLDIGHEYSPYESGLKRFVALDKGEFRGRSALQQRIEAGLKTKLFTVEIVNCTVQPIANAPVYNGPTMIGRITSGGYGHTINKVLALAYLDTDKLTSKNTYQAQILNHRYALRLIPDSPYDPENIKPRS